MLALVAGQGDLPRALIGALEAAERPYRLCELEGHPCAHRGNRPVIRFRVETLGSFLDTLAGNGTTEICFAGRIDRPGIDPALIDAATMPLVPDLMKAMAAGDDGALRQVMRLFEARGIRVVAAQDIAPDLLPDAGILTQMQPDAQAQKDADRGIEIIAAMGRVDVGQTCVVAGGQALAIETTQGTDWMLATLNDGVVEMDADPTWVDYAWPRMRAARIAGRGALARGDRGGCLVKAAKPEQDRRVDLPTIGPDTILRAHLAKLDGVVIEAGGVFVLDVAKCIELADARGMYIWVRA